MKVQTIVRLHRNEIPTNKTDILVFDLLYTYPPDLKLYFNNITYFLLNCYDEIVDDTITRYVYFMEDTEELNTNKYAEMEAKN